MEKPTGAAVMEAPAAVVQKADVKPKIEQAEQVYRLPIGEFRPSPTNPRKSFDADKLKEIGETMKIRQLHAVLGRRVPGKPGIELIAGECRWRAGTAVGLTHLNAVLIDADDVQVLKLQLIENMQRKDITALEEARAIQELMKRAKYDVAACAKELKLEPRTVYNRLELLKLPDFVLKELEAGILTPAHAALIGKLPKANDQKAALKAAIGEVHLDMGNVEYRERRAKVVISLRDLERWIASEVYHELGAMPWKLDDNKLCPKAGACSLCPKRTAAKPGSFPDAKKDCCLDTECFEEKRKAYVAQRLEAGAMAVSTEWYSHNKGVVNKEGWKESKSPKAVTAVVVEGDGVGRELKVELVGAKAVKQPKIDPETGKPEPKKVAPLAERRKVLEKRRQCWINDELKRRLNDDEKDHFTFEQFIATHKDKWAVRLFALIAVLGVEAVFVKGDEFDAYEKFAGEKPLSPAALDPIARAIWPELCHELVDQINYWDVESGAKRVVEAKFVVALMGEKWPNYVAAAAAALPEPKSWANEGGAKPKPAEKSSDTISGKAIAAAVKAAKKSKTPKAKKK